MLLAGDREAHSNNEMLVFARREERQAGFFERFPPGTLDSIAQQFGIYRACVLSLAGDLCGISPFRIVACP